MVPTDGPDDFATLATRREEADRSLVGHLVAEPGSAAAKSGLEAITEYLETTPTAGDRVQVTAPERGHQLLDTANAGTLLIVERQDAAVPASAWGRLVTLFANARYRGVHVVLVAPEIPTLVERAVTVRIDPDGDHCRAALLKPAEDDPERSRLVSLGTV